MKTILFIISTLLFALTWQCQAMDIQKPLTKKQWNEDTDKLLTQIKRLHPNPWRTVTEKIFQKKLDEIVKTSKTTDQGILSLIKAVANITTAGGDGHTGIWPLQQATGFHVLPLRLYWFEDGIFVIETDIDNKVLKGQRLTAIAGKSVDKILAKVRPYVSYENEIWLKSWLPLYILIPELLESLKLSKGLSVTITVKDETGKTTNKLLTGIDSTTYDSLFEQALNIAVLPVAATAPLYLQKVFNQRFWFKKLDENTLYMQYNLIFDEDVDGQSFTDFMELVEVEIKKYQLTNLILDLRNNGGGDNSAYLPFLDMLNNFKAKQSALSLYVLTGRVTFSAAVNLVIELDDNTNAILIGESTGGSPTQFGDPVTIELPNSKLSVRLSTKFWNNHATDKKAITINPDVTINLTSKGYFLNQDPVLTRTLELIKLKSFGQ